MNTRTGTALLGMVLAGTLLAGCGGGDGSSAAAADPPTPKLTLKAVCPQVEAAMPGSPVPSGAKLRALNQHVVALMGKGDLETKNALGRFSKQLTKATLAWNDRTDIMPGLTVSETYDDALNALAIRCKAAGSSALQ